MTKLSEILGARDLLLNLTLRELRSKYKRSVLGWAWSLLNPLATMVTYTLVFSVLLRSTPDEGDPSGLHVFALFLLCGLLPWNFLANAMNGAMMTLVGNGNLIKKVYFPRELLVIASVGSWLFSFLIEMGVLAVALLFFGNNTLPYLVPVLVVMVVQAMFVLGVSMVLSVFNVYFRDTQHLMGIVTQIWFYASPIIYATRFVEERLDGVALRLWEMNPMVGFIEVYRNLLYDLRLPELGTSLYLVAISLVVMVVGFWIFGRNTRRLAEEL